MAVVKRIPLGEKGEKVVVEQAVTVSGGTTKDCQKVKTHIADISVSDHGSNIHLATQFGSCDFLMPRFSTFCRGKNDDVSSPRKNIRNIKLQSLSQISKHESIALVIR